MKTTIGSFLASGLLALAAPCISQAQTGDAGGPYRVVTNDKVGGAGGFDYVYADSGGRRLYIPRANRVTVFNLDTLEPAGLIPGTPTVHGIAVDPRYHHGFSSSNPVVMFDSESLATIKTIAVQGKPDGILFDPATDRIFVQSHRAPNSTAIDARDGSVVGTIDLGGAPEQGASDGAGHLYFDIEDKDDVAVVDANTLQVTAHYDLGGKGGGPGGLALDAKNHVLFVFCHQPRTAVMLNADNGRILGVLPIGDGVDSAEFNPATGEAFSSQGDGTLTVIKEIDATRFAVEQNVATQAGAKTSTLDTHTGRIFLITADYAPPPATAEPTAGKGRKKTMIPGSFTILVVGK